MIHRSLLRIFSLIILVAVTLSPLGYTSSQIVEVQAHPMLQVRSNPSPALKTEELRQDGDLVAASVTPPTWQFECADCPKQIQIPDDNLDLDSSGFPHIAYGGDHLYYAWYDGSTWHTETVDTAAVVGSGASLKLDQDDNPHITYFDVTQGRLKYAHLQNGVWEIQIVDPNANGWGSLALDKAGQPHLVYVSNNFDLSIYSLKYAFGADNDWQIQTLEQGTGGVSYVSLALDSFDSPHVVYVMNVPSTRETFLKYGHWIGNVWDAKIIDQQDSKVYYPLGPIRLALDSTDQPHIFYYRAVQGAMRIAHYLYASLVDSLWNVQTIAQGYNGYGALALDEANHPHLCYSSTDGEIYAYWTGSSWTRRNVDEGSCTSLQLKENIPHLAYFDYYTETIKYVYWTGDHWNVQRVDSGGDVGWDNALALDANGDPHLSYVEKINKLIKYAHRSGNHWQSETVDQCGATVCHSSLAVDTKGNPWISYSTVGDGNGSLKLAHWNGSAWEIEMVDSVSGFNLTTSIALDAQGNPRISYQKGGLRYAAWTGSSWQIQVVDNQGIVGAYNSLALDQVGHAHISYQDLDTHSLKYAHWTGSNWDIQTVDNEGVAGLYTSLALDHNEHPHISYHTASPAWDLRYASWTGSAWKLETVDSTNYAGMFTSLALDVNDEPHISYGRSVTDVDRANELMVAQRRDERWEIQTIVTDQDAGVRATNLALDAFDLPQISYYDNENLLYTYPLPPLALESQATPSDGLHSGDILTFTLTLSAPGARVELWNPLPEQVEYITDSLSSTLTPTLVYSPTTHAMSWQGTIADNTIQVVSYQAKLIPVAAADGPSLPSIITTAWLTDTEHTRSISAITIVNGWHTYLPLLTK